MQENEFRGWDKEYEKMIYFADVFSWGGPINHADYMIWMQSTSVKDSNGKLIYDGDVLAYIHNTGSIEYVKKIDGCFCLCEYGKNNTESPFCHLDTTEISGSKWLMDYTVIGNIYENSEYRESDK